MKLQGGGVPLRRTGATLGRDICVALQPCLPCSFVRLLRRVCPSLHARVYPHHPLPCLPTPECHAPLQAFHVNDALILKLTSGWGLEVGCATPRAPRLCGTVLVSYHWLGLPGAPTVELPAGPAIRAGLPPIPYHTLLGSPASVLPTSAAPYPLPPHQARLMALPSVFLLSSPAVRGWADRLVSALLVGHRLGEPPLEEHQLESWLQVGVWRGLDCERGD